MSGTATITPEDVAVELVATKLAIVEVVSAIAKTGPPPELEAWASRSPVPLEGEEVRERVIAQSDLLEVAICDSIGAFFTRRAERLADAQSSA